MTSLFRQNKVSAGIIVPLLAILWMTMASCASTRATKTVTTYRDAGVRNAIVDQAKKYVGIRYRYGGTSSQGFDCSGLVHTSFLKNNISVPRTTRELLHFGQAVQRRDLQPGDLVFFKQKGKINHVALVTKADPDELWVIHSTTSRGVIAEEIRRSYYWADKIVAMRDVISP